MTGRDAHFLLTRYCVKLSPESRIPSDAWQQHRLTLFRSVCLPSVARQTNRDFSWLLFVDESVPEWLKTGLRQLARVGKYELIVLEVPFTGAVAASTVASRLPAGTQRVITTRLDNDDGLSEEGMSRIRSTARSLAAPAAINLMSGLQYRRGHLYLRRDPSSSFISLLENVSSGDRCQGVYCDDHDKLGQAFPVTHVGGSALWLQVLHGANVANRSYGVATFNRWPRGFSGIMVPVTQEKKWEFVVRWVLSVGRLVARVAVSGSRRRWLWTVVVGSVRRCLPGGVVGSYDQ